MTAVKNTSMNSGIAPRVFLSYARADGEPFATQLRQRLEAEHIPLWQDRVGLEGGKDWWLQITGALDKVEFMVLVMTSAAMRKEWRYARQQGVVTETGKRCLARSSGSRGSADQRAG